MDDQPNGSSIPAQPGDGDTPFSPPSKPYKQDDTHPATDTDLIPEDVYEEGVVGAAEITEPNAGNAVTGYDPAKDQRNSDNTDQP